MASLFPAFLIGSFKSLLLRISVIFFQFLNPVPLTQTPPLPFLAFFPFELSRNLLEIRKLDTLGSLGHDKYD